MNNRFIPAVIVTALLAYFGGWLLFGVLIADYYTANTSAEAAAIARTPPEMWAIAIVNMAWVLLITIILHKTGGLSFGRGFVTGLWVSLLILCIFNFSVYAFWKIYPLIFTITDIMIASIFWAFIGGIAGAVLGSGKRKV